MSLRENQESASQEEAAVQAVEDLVLKAPLDVRDAAPATH